MPPLSKNYLLVTDFGTDNVVFRFDGVTGAPRAPINVQVPAGEQWDWMPYGLATDRYGTPYVSIRNKNRVLRYRPETDMFERFTILPQGGFGMTYKPLAAIEGRGGRFYLCMGESVRVFTGSRGFDLGDFVPPGSGGLGTTNSAEFGPDGNFYVGEYSGRVLRYDGVSGAFIDVFVNNANRSFQFLDGLTFGPDGNLYTTSTEFWKVLRYNGTTGAFIDEFVPSVRYPGNLCFGPDGNLYVCSSSSIKRYNGTTGAYIDDFVKEGGGLYLPNDLEFVTLPDRRFRNDLRWRYVPRWLQVIGLGFVIGWAAAQIQQSRVVGRVGR